MRAFIALLFISLPTFAPAALITHTFDVRLVEHNSQNILKTATITLDGDTEAWTLGQASIAIDGMTLISEDKQQLGRDSWRYASWSTSWDPDPIKFTFTNDDWSFVWYDNWTEVTARQDENPILAFPRTSTVHSWEWYMDGPDAQSIGGRMFITDYHGWTYKVPEPSSIALLGLGLAALAFRRRSA